MDRLTRKSKNSSMVWFVDHERGGADREPCDMNSHHARIAIARLAEYEDLEEQGKLLKLPCAVGDKIYYLTGTPNSLEKGKFDRVEESEAVGFHVSMDGLMVQLAYDWHGNHGTYGYFGKTIFLTKEEAEEALERMVDRNE